jgi:hypothetical protein
MDRSTLKRAGTWTQQPIQTTAIASERSATWLRREEETASFQPWTFDSDDPPSGYHGGPVTWSRLFDSKRATDKLYYFNTSYGALSDAWLYFLRRMWPGDITARYYIDSLLRQHSQKVVPIPTDAMTIYFSVPQKDDRDYKDVAMGMQEMVDLLNLCAEREEERQRRAATDTI